MSGETLSAPTQADRATLRLGTRGSPLALAQSREVAVALEAHHPGLRVHLAVIRTSGDRIQDVALAKVGGKGLFVKEIEEALLTRRIELAVHSMKDLPAHLPPGLTLGAITAREEGGDVLVTREALSLDELPPGARVGTSSLRRQSQLLHRRPDLHVVPLRGNVDTRLRKLAEGTLDAIVVAAAGLKRLGAKPAQAIPLPLDVSLPAPGQGALGVEIREDDRTTAALVAVLEDEASRIAVTAERAFLRRLWGSCQVPIAAYGAVRGDLLTLTGLLASPDGKALVRDTLTGPALEAASLGTALAERLLAQGADRILRELAGELG
ncbi:MAG: hydroxymethylbilane synthase [candidate division NC10 bacterium]|nr:hydroxymethylbilane synthase [candidate division NC10 bacterium]